MGDKPGTSDITKKNFPSSVLHGIRGLLSLMFRSGEGISALAGQVHVQFSHLPGLASNEVKARIEYAPFPYRIIHSVFSGLRKLIDYGDRPEVQPDHVDLERMRGILNGVVGDRLHEWKNPLASSMRFLDHQGYEVEKAQGIDGDDIVVFLHGLCMTHHGWSSSYHNKFVESLRENGYRVLYLHYNSGRAIPDNGEDLHELLAELDRGLTGEDTVTLIGHSMGGLLARSACYFGREADADWLDRVDGIAYLGSPHFGAPLERLGFHANSLLGLLPFTRPFMSLGKIRSTGIRNLRYGTVRPEPPVDWDTIELAPDIDHLLVGSSINVVGEHTPLGDGLVPLSSSLGYEESTNRELTARSIRRERLKDVGHIELLENERVYSRLMNWLGKYNEEVLS